MLLNYKNYFVTIGVTNFNQIFIKSLFFIIRLVLINICIKIVVFLLWVEVKNFLIKNIKDYTLNIIKSRIKLLSLCKKRYEKVHLSL